MNKKNINVFCKYYINITLFICFNISFAQKEFSHWYFGEGAGLDFSSNSPIALNDGQMNTLEGCAVISDCNGNLLFYTNGVDVWNKNHSVMPNGSGLLGNESSSQAAVIVPRPGATKLYYIFAVDNRAGDNGLTYSEVNMAIGNGNGNVTQNKNVQLDDRTTEKLTVTAHNNGRDYWLIAHDWNSPFFLSYLVSDTGVSSTPIISAVGADHGGDVNNAIGCMKVSPNGERLAIAKISAENNSLVQVFDFDSTTGVISNLVFIGGSFYGNTNQSDNTAGAYGIEFSPDSKILYVSDIFLGSESKIHQFDISLDSQAEVINSDTIIYAGNETMGSLQLAIDNKIYIASSGKTYLSSIENPNLIGEACSFVKESIYLNGKRSTFGLPQFSYNVLDLEVVTNDACNGDANTFAVNFSEPIESISWDFGDGNTSLEESPSHTYEDPGIYSVNVTIGYGVFCKSKNVRVSVIGFSNFDAVPNYELCDDVTNDGTEVFSLASFDNEILQDVEGHFNITYHLSFADAENDINALESEFSNTENNQEIFFRIEIPENETCYQVGSFLLRVNQFGALEGDDATVNILINEWSPNNNTITIEVGGNGTYQYSLNGIAFQDSPYFENLNYGVFNVFIKDFDQCGVYKRQVAILNAPSYFTPNGDGFNDMWHIKLAFKRPDLMTYIYDRFGKLITLIKANDYGWDGTYNGQPLPQSDYWYVVKSESSGKQHTGHFTLKR